MQNNFKSIAIFCIFNVYTLAHAMTPLDNNYAHPTAFQSALVQENGVMLPLDQAISASNGKIERVSGTNKYDITIKNRTLRIDLDSKSGVMDTVNFVYPGRIHLNILFISSLPNNKVYFDSSDIDEATDSQGNAQITDLYPIPGKHNIQLMKNGFVKAKADITAYNTITFKCTGKREIKCIPVN